MSKVNWFLELVTAAGKSGYGVELVRCSNTGGPYLEIEVAKMFKGKAVRVMDREKVKRTETVETAAKRLLTRMKQEAQI